MTSEQIVSRRQPGDSAPAAPTGRIRAAGIVLGVGLGGIFDGIVHPSAPPVAPHVDQRRLSAHRVRDDVSATAQALWDVAFLLWGAAMIAVGWLLSRRPARRA